MSAARESVVMIAQAAGGMGPSLSLAEKRTPEGMFLGQAG
jgi:hypothetical protein